MKAAFRINGVFQERRRNGYHFFTGTILDVARNQSQVTDNGIFIAIAFHIVGSQLAIHLVMALIAPHVVMTEGTFVLRCLVHAHDTDDDVIAIAI